MTDDPSRPPKRSIQTVADLLERIAATQRPILDEEDVKHGTTVGNMYEGLTAHLLRQGLPFTGVSLDVVSGFAQGDDGSLSPQMDCMIVVGEGRALPFTQERVYPLDQVIAAIEVKKTLYATEIKDAYEKCRKVTQLFPKKAHITYRIIDQAFVATTGRPVPEEPLELPRPLRAIHDILTRESVLPARIVWGYHGYKSFTAFRKAVADDLIGRIGESGHGPLAMPTLIANDRFAIVKGDGMPYAFPLKDDADWMLMMSSSEPPVRVLLEIVWSRLTARYGEIEGMFGDDLEYNRHYRFLDFRLHASERAWELASYADVDIDARIGVGPITREWTPTWLTDTEFYLVSHLCNDAEAELDTDTPLQGMTAEVFGEALETLVSKRLVGPDPIASSVYRLLSRQLVVGISPDGRLYAAENADGRLERWLAKQLAAARVR